MKHTTNNNTYNNLLVYRVSGFIRVKYRGLLCLTAIDIGDGAIQILDSNVPELERGTIFPTGIIGAIGLIKSRYESGN